ncbi:MAG TPA: fibronectin type III domain-containing protein, partial [Polyangiaceae bacterium]|nr:fibronectin type III domain-containing protein [Polyangiaceae bacterium]
MRRRLGRAVLGAPIAAASLTLGWPVEAQAASDGATIARGTARSRPNATADWHDAAPGEVLGMGTEAEVTGTEPLELKLPDGVRLTLEPGASARLLPAGRLPNEINGWTRGFHLVLTEGEVEVRMPTGPKGRFAFLVSTRAGTLTDWRGQLHVMVHGETTAAGIYEGALVVGSNGQGFPVHDGAGILMREGVDPDKSLAIPAAPGVDRAATPLPLVVEGAPATLDVRWVAGARAASYRVEVATDAAMDHVVSRATTTETRYLAPEPSPGASYWVRVRAVGPEGIVGDWSPPHPVRIARYKLPDRAFVARDGAIVLPRGASVALSDPTGLEVAYENVTRLTGRADVPLYWAAVTGPLRPGEEHTVRLVHVREAGTAGQTGEQRPPGQPPGGEGRLFLAQRELRADVELTPRDAHWPIDPIDIHVVVRDPSGRIDVGTEPVAVTALLDLSP